MAEIQNQINPQVFNMFHNCIYKEMATHSSILAWRIPGTEEPSGLSSMGRTELDTTEVT